MTTRGHNPFVTDPSPGNRAECGSDSGTGAGGRTRPCEVFAVGASELRAGGAYAGVLGRFLGGRQFSNDLSCSAREDREGFILSIRKRKTEEETGP